MKVQKKSPSAIRLYTIGFTKKSAREFFGLLYEADVKRLVDIRLRPDSQLSGFAKREDLAYFLENLIKCGYIYEPRLAPTDELINHFRKSRSWEQYEKGYLSLLNERYMPAILDRGEYEAAPSCLLCSEADPAFCHRRLAAEAMKHIWGDVQIVHL